jgi:hypothetical protein
MVANGNAPMTHKNQQLETRLEILRFLQDLSDVYPEWRFGQMVANAAMWAAQPTEPGDTGVWDVEDAELLAALKRHLTKRQQAHMAGG